MTIDHEVGLRQPRLGVEAVERRNGADDLHGAVDDFSQHPWHIREQNPDLPQPRPRVEGRGSVTDAGSAGNEPEGSKGVQGGD